MTGSFSGSYLWPTVRKEVGIQSHTLRNWPLAFPWAPPQALMELMPHLILSFKCKLLQYTKDLAMTSYTYNPKALAQWSHLIIDKMASYNCADCHCNSNRYCTLEQCYLEFNPSCTHHILRSAGHSKQLWCRDTVECPNLGPSEF